ncbi:MAG: AAA family ATPase, partial [Deltaproteobacteria bacterium]|nr:AAA family ATPase [Deltaproteobacteria bacterium]
MTLKELYSGDWSFEEMIDRNFLYADKTQYIYAMLGSNQKGFFLSRPRRFGKTLLLSTLDELFSGNRELFKGLWIGESDYDFPKHPIINLSLSTDVSTPETLAFNLLAKLREIARGEGLQVPEAPLASYFGFLIKALYERYNGTKVVILIDEYDAPVTR